MRTLMKFERGWRKIGRKSERRKDSESIFYGKGTPMKVKKECSKEERRNQILAYLRGHETVCRTELMEHFSITKATLSTDLSALEALGNPIEKVSRGVIRLAMQASSGYHTESEYAGEFPAKISGSEIRQWIILFLLNQSAVPLSRSRLEKEYSNIILGDEYSESFLRSAFQKALHTLVKSGFIEHLRHNSDRLHDTYRLTTQAPVIWTINSTILEQFYEKQLIYHQTTPVQPVFKSFDKKVDFFVNNGISQSEMTYYTHGRTNLLPTEEKQKLLQFQMQPYQTRQLRICFRSGKGGLEQILFSVGLCVYSMDKNRFYLLGETSGRKIILRMDRMLSFEASEEPNLIYHSQEYRQIYDEMFSISIDDPVQVRIRFQRIYGIEKKVELLKSMRKKAVLTYTEKELIYEDTIRGLPDFSGYLRRFGRSVLVDEPTELKEKMINSAKRTISRYEEILYSSCKEESDFNEP